MGVNERYSEAYYEELHQKHGCEWTSGQIKLIECEKHCDTLLLPSYIIEHELSMIGPIPFAVYMVMLRFAENRQICTVSCGDVGSVLGISPYQVQDAIEILEDNCWIEGPEGYSSLRKSLTYTLLRTCVIERDNKGQYAEYLKSGHWKKVRSEAIAAANNRCQICNRVGKLNVHHRTYERVGEEDPSDLVVLCSSCHATFHGKMEKP